MGVDWWICTVIMAMIAVATEACCPMFEMSSSTTDITSVKQCTCFQGFGMTGIDCENAPWPTAQEGDVLGFLNQMDSIEGLFILSKLTKCETFIKFPKLERIKGSSIEINTISNKDIFLPNLKSIEVTSVDCSFATSIADLTTSGPNITARIKGIADEGIKKCKEQWTTLAPPVSSNTSNKASQVGANNQNSTNDVSSDESCDIQTYGTFIVCPLDLLMAVFIGFGFYKHRKYKQEALQCKPLPPLPSDQGSPRPSPSPEGRPPPSNNGSDSAATPSHSETQPEKSQPDKSQSAIEEWDKPFNKERRQEYLKTVPIEQRGYQQGKNRNTKANPHPNDARMVRVGPDFVLPDKFVHVPPVGSMFDPVTGSFFDNGECKKGGTIEHTHSRCYVATFDDNMDDNGEYAPGDMCPAERAKQKVKELRQKQRKKGGEESEDDEESWDSEESEDVEGGWYEQAEDV